MPRIALMIAALMLCAGCQTASVPAPRPTEYVGEARRPAVPARESAEPRVYLMRGLAQTVSEGVDTMAAKMNARGYVASVHAYGDWAAIATRIMADERAGGRRRPVVVIGHSLGANSVVQLVNALGQRGLAVDLAVTFDPTQDLVVEGGARRVVNLFQSDNLWGKALVRGPGFRGSLENVDVKAMTHLTHFNIDRDAALHERVLAWIAGLGREGARSQRR